MLTVLVKIVYDKKHKQNVMKINITESIFKRITFWGATNDLFLWLTNADIHNFANGNTISKILEGHQC